MVAILSDVLEKLLGWVEYIPFTSFAYSRLGILALSKCQQYVPVYVRLLSY